MRGQRGAVHQAGLDIGALDLHRRDDQAFDRVGDVVALVDHVREVKARRLLQFDQLVEHQEQPERLDRAGIQIVVAVFRVVEMEAAQLPGLDQPGDDHLDVHVRGVVAQVDQTLRLRPQRLRGHQAGAPVLHHGGIERGFVHLVFREQPPVRGQGGIDLGHRREIAVELLRQRGLAGEVRPVADPDRQRLRPQRAAKLDAVDVVRHRLRPGRRVGMAERAVAVAQPLVRLVLEGVRVHRVEAQPQRVGLRLQFGRVGLVPGDVERDLRRRPGQPVDDGTVFKLVEDVARLARAGEAREAGAAGAGAPGRDGDAEAGGAVGQGLDIDAAAGKPCRQRVVVGRQIRAAGSVLRLDQVRIDHGTHRGKAWTLPASTFRMFPVDLADRSEAKKKTPSAMSSGRTDRFSIERWRYISSSPSLSVL